MTDKEYEFNADSNKRKSIFGDILKYAGLASVMSGAAHNEMGLLYVAGCLFGGGIFYAKGCDFKREAHEKMIDYKISELEKKLNKKQK